MTGKRCHFHSFYDTPGWHILKLPNLLKFSLISISGSRAGHVYQFLVITYFCTFKLLLN